MDIAVPSDKVKPQVWQNVLILGKSHFKSLEELLKSLFIRNQVNLLKSGKELQPENKKWSEFLLSVKSFQSETHVTYSHSHKNI